MRINERNAIYRKLVPQWVRQRTVNLPVRNDVWRLLEREGGRNDCVGCVTRTKARVAEILNERRF